MLSAFFIDRPKFAFVISIVLSITGVIGFYALPVAQFPDIVPPQVKVTASYPGASSEVVANTVAAPIEAEVNGVDDMLYMTSTSDNRGNYELTVTFDVGTDPDINSVNVQNRVALATPKLPEEVTRQGVSTKKQSTTMLMIVNVYSPNATYDRLFLSNYTEINIRDVLVRLPGVGDANQLGGLDYGMRIWLDPDRMTTLALSTDDVIGAIETQNIQASAGQIGSPPFSSPQQFQYQIQARGRLANPKEFGDIIVRANQDGSIVRMRDIAKIELGAKSYDAEAKLDGGPTAMLAVYQSPGANALDTADDVYAELDRLAERFPDDVTYEILYDTTNFVRASMDEVYVTLFQALGLVILVTFLFLGDWRATLIPVIAIPVSLIGTFAILLAAGFSINTISLFGIILAIGIVVDDAIVVVENAQRIIDEEGLSPKDATRKAMLQVTGPVIATTLVLLAVFAPTAFLPGITGQLYLQFAVTISTAVVISSINALTLSPALCGLVLRKSVSPRGPLKWFFKLVDVSRDGYASVVGLLVRRTVLGVGLLAIAIGGSAYMFRALPTGFIPYEDNGYFFVDISLPDGASLQRSEEVVDQVSAMLLEQEGITNVLSVSGYSLLSGGKSNAGLIIPILADWEERDSPDLHVEAIINRVQPLMFSMSSANIFAFNAPPITGLGTAGGVEMELQDSQARPAAEFGRTVNGFITTANANPVLDRVFTTYSASTPQLFLEVDREKTQTLGIPIGTLFSALQANLGSYYVNDFNLFGRTYQVQVQADSQFRRNIEDIGKLHVANANGDMVPISTLVKVTTILGPEIVRRHNLFQSASINGSAATGNSTGQAIQAVQSLQTELPDGYSVAWSGTTFQEVKSGGETGIVLALALLFVYLFLVAQYESWSIPFPVILSVSFAVAGGLLALIIGRLDFNVYSQIGLVMLIGLASKNAILIVEFAKQLREEGKSVRDAGLTAARLRFRAVMMTSFSFVLGVVPLVVASGAGAASRVALGMVVMGGMLAASVIAIFVIPPLYVLVQSSREWVHRFGDKGKKEIAAE